jgi:hypothetical protein
VKEWVYTVGGGDVLQAGGMLLRHSQRVASSALRAKA